MAALIPKLTCAYASDWEKTVLSICGWFTHHCEWVRGGVFRAGMEVVSAASYHQPISGSVTHVKIWSIICYSSFPWQRFGQEVCKAQNSVTSE